MKDQGLTFGLVFAGILLASEGIFSVFSGNTRIWAKVVSLEEEQGLFWVLVIGKVIVGLGMSFFCVKELGWI